MHSLLDPLLPLWGTCEHEGKHIIAAAFPYLLPEECYTGRNVSRYAVVQDYHKICGARLEKACAFLQAAFPWEEFHWHCDSTALPEVELAVRAGLGVRGKHNLLITKKYGSWVFLGEIVTTAKLPIQMPNAECGTLNCDSCNACLKACPTGTLNDDSFNKTKCLSFISQKKDDLTPAQAALLRRTGTAWGCDLCQESCPHNRGATIEPLPEFLVEPIACVSPDTPIAGRAYAWRREGVIKRNLGLLTPPLSQLPQNPPP